MLTSYNPVPDVQERPTPLHVSVDANPNMFGAAVGQALSHFGDVSQDSANQVFAEAQQLQRMHNEATARNAQAQNLDAQSQLLNQFQTKLGADAGPEAFGQFRQQAEQLRTQNRDALTNPQAQSIYDAESINALSQSYRMAGYHSAQQTKSYALQSRQAAMTGIDNSVLGNPDDEIGFQQSIAQKKALAQQQATDMGLPAGSPEAEKLEKTSVSELAAARIQGFTRSNPQLAYKLFNQELAEGGLYGADIEKTQRAVQSAMLSHGSKQTVDSIYDGSSMQLGKGQVPIERAAQAIADIESSGGNYSLRGPVVTKGQYAGEQALGKYQVMPGNLSQWLQQAGMPQMTPEQFLSNHQAQDDLFAKRFGADMQKYGNANDAAAVWFTGQPMGAVKTGDGYTSPPQYIAQFNAGLAKTASTTEKVGAARSLAETQAPDLPLMPDYVEQQVIAKDRQQTAMAKQDEYQRRSTIEGAIAAQQGHSVGSLEQLAQTSPDVAKLIDSMSGPDKLKVMTQLRAAQNQDDIPSPQRDANRKALVGMSYSDPDKFQNIDPYAQDLTATDRKSIIGIQGTMVKGAARDPSVSDAIRILKPQLDAAGVQNTADTRQDYDQYVGALHDQLLAFQKQNGRPAGPNDITAIGQRLLSDQVVGKGWFGGDKTSPMYQVTPPDDYSAKMRAQYPTASAEQIRQRYVRDIYRAAVAGGK